MPGNPKLSLIATWALSYDPLGDWAPDTPFVRALQLFLRGDNAERGNIFKLIPRCAFPSLHACFVPAIHLQGIGLGSRPDGLRDPSFPWRSRCAATILSAATVASWSPGGWLS